MKAWLRALLYSFYSQPFYRDVAQGWKGLGFRFLFLFAFIPAAVSVISAGELRPVLARLPEIATHLPDTYYQGKRILIREKVPYNIYLNNEPPLFAVIDTRYSEYGLEGVKDWMREHHVALFITSTHAVFYHPDAERIIPVNLKHLPGNFAIGQARWQKLAAFISHWTGTFIFIGSLMITFISFMLSALLMGVIGKIIALTTGAMLEYPALVRLASVTTVPVWATTELFGLFSHQGFASLLIARLTYLFVAIRANK